LNTQREEGRRMGIPSPRTCLFVGFLLSGTAAVGYQILWQRLLSLILGSQSSSATLTVCAFLAGLAGGAAFAGRVADYLPPRRTFSFLLLIELLTAVIGLNSPTILHHVSKTALPLPVLGALAFSVVALGSFLMGATLPLMGRLTTQADSSVATESGLLVGVNTLGSAFGAALTTWILLPSAGVSGSATILAAINLIASALVTLPLFAQGSQAVIDLLPLPKEQGNRHVPIPVPPLVLAGASGFIGLGLEMLWFRILGVSLKAHSFTFGTLLAFHLAGLAAGAASAGAFFQSRQIPRWMAPVLLTAPPLLSMLILASGVYLLDPAGPCVSLRDYLVSYEPWTPSSVTAAGGPNPQWIIRWLHVWLPLVSIFPVACLTGALFPCLQSLFKGPRRGFARPLGIAQAVNLLGSLVGAPVTTFVLIPFAGTAGTFRYLACAALAAATACGATLPRSTLPLLASSTLALCFLVPSNTLLWQSLHGTPNVHFKHREDSTGIAAITSDNRIEAQSRTLLLTNGIGQSWFPYGGVHSLLGALPALIHPNPTDIAIIGLGSADTLFAASCRKETRSLTCVEILPAVRDLLSEQVRAHIKYPALESVLLDPRIRHVSTDGRFFLRNTVQRFDLIETDAIRPTSAGAGNLYSKEFFEIAKARLKPGGIFVTWLPSNRVRMTFLAVFSHTLELPHMLLGSESPIAWDFLEVRLRAHHRHHLSHFQTAGIDLPQLFHAILPTPDYAIPRSGTFPTTTPVSLNTDLNPRDEFRPE
jgi:spermidine synthase